MNEAADRAAVSVLALIASEANWSDLVSAESIGQAQKTAWVQELGIEPSVLVEAAAAMRAIRAAYEQIREPVGRFCPSPPCWDDGLSRVILEVFRMYYRLRLPPGGVPV